MNANPLDWTRRDLLRLTIGAPLAAFAPVAGADSRAPSLDLAALRRARGRVVAAPGSVPATRVQITRDRHGARCRTRVRNAGAAPVSLAEVILFEGPHGLPAETPIYGEGFQMLSQTSNTVPAPRYRTQPRIAEIAQANCGLKTIVEIRPVFVAREVAVQVF